jgi:hypothetical protein
MAGAVGAAGETEDLGVMDESVDHRSEVREPGSRWCWDGLAVVVQRLWWVELPVVALTVRIRV